MRDVCRASVVSLAATLCLCAGSIAQQAGRIESMKLLTLDTGWAATNKKLFWTTDGGVQWKDITPKLSHKRQMVSSVFFLDSSTGWVLLSCGDDRDPKVDNVCFEFASTTDAGETWSAVHPKIVDSITQTDYSDWTGYSGATFLDFADSQHGWAILQRNLPVGRSSGEMLRTVDGGRTWTQLAKGTLPVAGNMYFLSAEDGWMAGGPDQELYATHDAGNSWKPVDVAAPKQIPQDLSPVYRLPTFVDGRTGYLAVTYESSMSSGTPVALFKTEDGGTTWHPTLTTPALSDMHPWAPYPAAITSGKLLTATISGGRIDLSHAEQGVEAKHELARISMKASSADQLSFISPDRGWILATYWLLSTKDGGITWIDVTPDPAGTVPALASSTGMPRKMSAPAAATIPLAGRPSSKATGNVSTHLGFDTFPTPSTSTMQAWATSSPFYDVNIYLYGSPNKSTVKSKYPNQQWLSTVEGYGWGIIPTWFGLQSSCVNDSTGITQFISTTPATASTQGAGQADLAVAADKSLGITGGIIYVDIESYTVGGACSAAVQAYVDGFVSEIAVYSGYSAGVYANSGPITSDISQVSPAPSAIWITKTPPKTKPTPQVTIWNLGVSEGANGSPSLWPNSQRMHQFLLNQSNTFGTAPSLNIDPDIDNGPVVNANAFVKTYTYGTPANIDCGGAIATFPIGINDMHNGAFINGPGQMGTVVGWYEDANFATHGFQNAGSGCTEVIFSGAYPGSIQPTAINNLGQIAGTFTDSAGKGHGFLLSPGKSPVQIDYPNANQIYIYGVNDAGQVVGYAYSPDTYYFQTFMYYGGTTYPLGSSGNFVYTLGLGINGDATITGSYYFEPDTEAFTVSAIPPAWDGPVNGLDPDGLTSATARDINANDEIGGYYYSSACMNTGSECGFFWSGGLFLNILKYGTTANTIWGINDFAQAVGPYSDASTAYSHGLLWTHQ